MADEHLKTLHGLYERWGRGDFGSDVHVLDPHVLLVMRPEFPDAGTYIGHEGMSRYTRGFLEPWTRVTITAEEMIPAGDSVVAKVFQSGVGTASGAPVEFRYFQVWTFRGDKAIRLEMFREREEALEAVGLTP